MSRYFIEKIWYLFKMVLPVHSDPVEDYGKAKVKNEV